MSASLRRPRVHDYYVVGPQARQAPRGQAALNEAALRISYGYFVGICIETSAVAEQNTLWLPRVDFSDCHLRLLPLEEQRQPHAEENLTIGMVHPGELCGPSAKAR